MNLEQIDTSTTAGKAEVMRLAAEGRRVAFRPGAPACWDESQDPVWNWSTYDYAIISEPIGPEEMWAVQFSGYISNFNDKTTADAAARKNNGTVVLYIRADLAGEKG